MAKETDNLILEHLRAIRSDQAEANRRLRNVEQAVVSINQYQATMMGDITNMRERFPELEVKIDRIEKRLDLTDA